MTIIADHLRHIASDLEKAAGAIEKLEAERDEYKRRLTVAADVIERCSLRLSFAENSELEQFKRAG